MTHITVHTPPLNDNTLRVVEELTAACFSDDPDPPGAVGTRVQHKRKPMVVIAWDNTTPVAYKLGYETNDEEFYSWLGGVVSAYRRRGIADALMVRQHQWCKEAGYTRVTTKALNDNPAMIMLNLKHGFIIVGTQTDDRGTKVLMTRDFTTKPMP